MQYDEKPQKLSTDKSAHILFSHYLHKLFYSMYFKNNNNNCNNTLK